MANHKEYETERKLNQMKVLETVKPGSMAAASGKSKPKVPSCMKGK